ncbi:MAG: ABC transporter ATP-binding protein [Ignavibacteria bacterium]|nr:ABC transporter ATP-binding protein [Ignavibacteria bacterium]MBK7157242.1 ABC transporter ATP-binding protein [Ignavibacteria bacterium]MBK7256183.1 ABC transporter ATP-binding protein [Ignavibacteria bacterium]MBK7444595.1 ABC transporter ATP-binding protein [Ignavibacteria bacterium]MBK9403583.1 ABC transporter ATP-binding protein [Ignavibacteria bacterium]
MKIITTKNLSKEYSSKSFSKEKILALNNFSFEVESGEIFGILGPNGAGKTTLIKILLGITHRTNGDIKIFEKEISDESYKMKIGYLPENHKFPNYLTGEQVLYFFGKLSGLTGTEVKKRADEYLGLMDMQKWRKTKIKKYSKGMMQRLGLAQSLLNNPELVFLDEPTDGVDPIGRKEIRDILNNLKSQGKTIFLNSHLLSEVELICDRVAILNKGSLVKEGKVGEITSASNNYKFITSEISEKNINDLLINFKAVIHSRNEFVYNTINIEDLNKLIDFLRENKILIHSVNREKDTLENMFINLIESQN